MLSILQRFRSHLLSLIMTSLMVILDQWTKWLAVAKLPALQPKVIFSWLNLSIAYNRGASFSLLSQSGLWGAWFLTVFSTLASIIILYLLIHTPLSSYLKRIALISILAGALGNLIDRLHQGYVVDFIQVHYHQWYWPTFNIADSILCIGFVILSLAYRQPQT